MSREKLEPFRVVAGVPVQPRQLAVYKPSTKEKKETGGVGCEIPVQKQITKMKGKQKQGAPSNPSYRIANTNSTESFSFSQSS